MLTKELRWNGRCVRWGSAGSGPSVVFCHGTPWSSVLWQPFASALATQFTVYLWDMPGYGLSSKDPDHDVSLDIQGRVFSDLLDHWGLSRPHVVAHDYGGTVALRAHLLHGCPITSLALVDVVALRPWGTDFLRLVRENVDVLEALPSAIHLGALEAYIGSASHRGVPGAVMDSLTAPWRGALGQSAFYRQIAQASEGYTEELEPLYEDIQVPTLVVWGREDTWLPVQVAHRLRAAIPGAQLQVVEDAGHLVQVDQPARLSSVLTTWLLGQWSSLSDRQRS